MEILHLLQLFVELVEWVSRGDRLNLLLPDAFCIFVDIKETLGLFLDTGEEAGNLVVST